MAKAQNYVTMCKSTSHTRILNIACAGATEGRLGRAIAILVSPYNVMRYHTIEDSDYVRYTTIRHPIRELFSKDKNITN